MGPEYAGRYNEVAALLSCILTATFEEGIAMFVAIGTAWVLSIVTSDHSASVSMYCVCWQIFWDLAYCLI